MRLSEAQLEQFDSDGYLVLPGLFSAAEIAPLRGDLARIFALDRPEVPKTETGESRLAHRLERYSAPFDLLLHHPRMVEPARQILGGPVYSHQYKVVTKEPFGNLDFPWHQDYATWHAMDGMPAPHALNMALFLDDVGEFNGPIIVIPGSHKGLLDGRREPLDGSSDFESLDPDTVRDLTRAGAMVAPKGAAGTGLIFHGCTAHTSVPNVSPWPRRNVYSSLNRIDNALQRPTRPEFYANRRAMTLETYADDCLLAYASTHSSGP
jgi:ectoine hydroxylase